MSPLNPNACTNDGDLPNDPSKLYPTVEGKIVTPSIFKDSLISHAFVLFSSECCKVEFDKIHGCNVFRASCDEPSRVPTAISPRTNIPTHAALDTGDEVKRPTNIPTRTLTPTPFVPTPLAKPDSLPPSSLTRKSLADTLNQLYESGNVTQNRIQLRDALKTSGVDFNADYTSVNATGSNSHIDAFNENSTELLESFILERSELKCKCVHCKEDLLCGGLWSGTGHSDEGETDPDLHIHIVVSHCKSPLDWLEEFTEGFAIESLHVITKCGFPVDTPESSTVIELSNVGRCDHSYAWYISNILPGLVIDNDNSVVVFLKDDISYDNMHQLGEWSELRHLTSLASTDQGFACGINSMDVRFSQSRFSLSAFHETKTLARFAIDSYQRNLKGYALDSTQFKSEYKSLGSWWNALGIEPIGDLTQVCYGGVFAASVKNIRMHTLQFWQSLEANLSRGNNIQEGHYAERSWAMLIATPLEQYQAQSLIDHSDGVYINMSSMHGALMQLPKLFLHIGAKATTSTEILSETLIKHLENLHSDGYKVAVHGKHDLKHDFPNVDRLASCMWSQQLKNSFPEYMKEATICPERLLPDLSRYMNKAVQDHQDMIILNPWLSRRGSADSLALYLDPVWDVHPVIYYRRYYEWITVVHEEWRAEILQHASNLDHMPFSSFRYIDFLREYNKRLFLGKDVTEDGYPIRSFGGSHSDEANENEIVVQRFDPTSNSRVEDLTDLADYTYFVAKEYSLNSRFHRHLTIVNYHDFQSIETNFICRVLHDAHNACRAAAEEELTKTQGHRSKNFVQTDPEFPIHLRHAIQDIVVAAVKAGRLRADESSRSNDVPLQLRLWVQQVYSAFKQSTITSLTDLPIECLYNFEVNRLLEVSLAYEKSLLPAFYESSNGAAGLIREFSRFHFCSVDAEKVINDARWDFLFDFTSTLIPRFDEDEPV